MGRPFKGSRWNHVKAIKVRWDVLLVHGVKVQESAEVRAVTQEGLLLLSRGLLSSGPSSELPSLSAVALASSSKSSRLSVATSAAGGGKKKDGGGRDDASEVICVYACNLDGAAVFCCYQGENVIPVQN